VLLLWTLLNCVTDDEYYGIYGQMGGAPAVSQGGSYLGSGRACRKGTDQGHGERAALRHSRTSSVS
jgi:hypothetical protein